MTIEDAIKTIELAIAEVEWVYPIDYAAAFDVAVSALRAKEEKPSGGWISVEDRLPEAGGYVVCIAKRNPFSRFMPMVARIEKNGWVNPITEQYISEVTHWMQLPDPPEEERT